MDSKFEEEQGQAGSKKSEYSEDILLLIPGITWAILISKLFSSKIVSEPFILKYIENGCEHGYRISNPVIIELDRVEDLKFLQSQYQQKQRLLLWHGTKLKNLASIISNGFQKPDDNKQMFGKGIYFADRFSKSANYCGDTSEGATGYVFLCEVAVGKSYIADKAEKFTSAPTIPTRNKRIVCDSVLCVGENIPDVTEQLVLPNKLIVPCGSTVENQNIPQCTLAFNEYIVYNPELIKIRYLVKFEFNYKREKLTLAPAPIPKEAEVEKIVPYQTVITTALANKLRGGKCTALFYKKVENKSSTPHKNHFGTDGDYWRWKSISHVMLPMGPTYKTWVSLRTTLHKLKVDCQKIVKEGQDTTQIGEMLGEAVFSYQKFAKMQEKLSFDVISEKELSNYVVRTLPLIIDFALELPNLLAEPIPILGHEKNQTLFVSKRLCCSLLAHAFLSTYPEPWPSMPNINFTLLLNNSEKEKLALVTQKVICILNYFYQMKRIISDEKDIDGLAKFEHSIISFERRYITQKMDWLSSTRKLAPVNIDINGRVEDKLHSLQVDFANKIVGGEIIGGGCGEEEILFSVSPELILARLFTEPLDDDEVLIIKGVQQFSNYPNEGPFKFHGPVNNFQMERDSFNRMQREVVLMDPKRFSNNGDEQYLKFSIDRELHKCFLGFLVAANGSDNRHVATGNWGCGAFNGDPELKFIIQWMGVSQTKRKGMIYHTNGDVDFTKKVQNMADFLQKNLISVGDLYKIITSFYGEQLRRPTSSIFSYLEQQVLNI